MMSVVVVTWGVYSVDFDVSFVDFVISAAAERQLLQKDVSEETALVNVKTVRVRDYTVDADTAVITAF